MSDKKKYIIAIAKEEALFPQNFDDQNYFDYKQNYDVFFEGELSEEELNKKFDDAIQFVCNTYGRGPKFRPVFVYDGDGDFIMIEGSSNINFLRYK